MSQKTIDDLLPAPMLERFRSRAGGYDERNAFFTDDLDELRAAGYLAAPVPRFPSAVPDGGATDAEREREPDPTDGGLGLEELVRAQRRLAAHAPATALGINMHLVWVQVARFLHDRDDHRLDWVLADAVAGEIFAFGISEAGNDAVLLDSFSEAHELPGGGYEVSGTKVFTTLSPVWTRLGVHARIRKAGPSAGAPAGAEPPEAPPAELVFGFVRREGTQVRRSTDSAEGLSAGTIRHPGTWNPLGMRATQSYTTELDGVRIEPGDVAAVMPGFDPSDPLVLAIFSSFSILTAAVYAGIADRALELATAAVGRPMRRPDGSEGSRLDDPDPAARLTSAVLEHRRSLDALTLLSRDVDSGRVRDDWFLALAAARNQVTDEARGAVEVAMRLSGARAGYQADGELARLYRDVLAGMFHPSSSAALAQTVRAMLR